MPRKRNQKRNSVHQACSCLKCATRWWLLSLVGFIMSLALIGMTQIPSWYEQYLSDPARDGNVVYEEGVAAISSIYARVVVEPYIVEHGFGLKSEFIDGSLRGEVITNPPTTAPENLDDIGLIWMVWYKSLGSIFAVYMEEEFFPEKDIILRVDSVLHNDSVVLDTVFVADTVHLDLIAAAGSFQYFEIPYQEYRSGQSNLEQLEFLISSFLIENCFTEVDSSYVDLITGNLYTQAQDSIYQRRDAILANLYWHFPSAPISLISLGVLVFCSSLWFRAWYDIRRAWRSLYRAHLLYQGSIDDFGNCLSTPRSVYLVFWRDRSAGYFDDYYQSLYDSQVKAEEKRREEETAQLQYHLLLKVVEAEMTESFSDDLPWDIERQLIRCNRVRKSWAERLFELNAARMLIHTRMASSKKIADPVRNIKTYEETLWEQVDAIVTSELSIEQAKKFDQMIATASMCKRQSKRFYWLHLALNVALGKVAEDDYLVAAAITNDVGNNEGSNGEGIMTFEKLITMLGIASLIPDTICSDHAAWIILALARPGESAPCVLAKYTQEENIHRKVRNNALRYTKKQYQAAFNWLDDNGVIVRFKSSRHELDYSLNIKEGEASILGRPIVSRVNNFLHVTRRMTAT